MSVGLLGLLDDIAGIAKIAAASLDDIVKMSAKASLKASGAVIDDAAVTPKYVHGFTADRELPIVASIAKGSLKNKLFILLPAALVLGTFLPIAIMPLLMIGGAYLCYEGAEKVLHALAPKVAHEHESHIAHTAVDPQTLEEQRIAGAIKTDFILSAEIMAIALAELSDQNFVYQAVALVVVALGITIGVYGVVALIVKADDAGLALARREGSGNAGLRALGRGVVKGMPWFMRGLMAVGTAAMTWVGGGIVVHGLESMGLHALEGLMHDAVAIGHPYGGWAEWGIETLIYFGAGLILGAILIPVVEHVISPVWRVIGKMLPKRASVGNVTGG